MLFSVTRMDAPDGLAYAVDFSLGVRRFRGWGRGVRGRGAIGLAREASAVAVEVGFGAGL